MDGKHDAFPTVTRVDVKHVVMSGADMGVFPVIGVPVFGRWEIVEGRYSSGMFQPSAELCYEAQAIHLVSYSTVMG